MGAKIKAIFVVLILSLVFLHSKSSVMAAACDGQFPASVLANDPFSAQVELPIPNGVNPSDLAICPSDPLTGNPATNDPVGKYCFRLSVCKTGRSGTGGCNTLIGTSWFTPGNPAPGAVSSNMQISPDGKFLLLNWSYDLGVTFKLEANDKRTNASATRFNACSSEWNVPISLGTASCGSNTFSLTGPNGTSANPLTLSFDGSKTNRFASGQYDIWIRPLSGGGNKHKVQQLYNPGSTQNNLACGTIVVPGTPSCSMNLNDPSLGIGNLAPGDWEIVIQDAAGTATYCNFPFKMDATGVTVPPTNNAVEAIPFTLCDQAAEVDRDACRSCVSSGNIDDPTDANQKFWTAFGCVSLTQEGIVTSLLRIGIGLAGGFVLLSILYGSFLLTTSSGDPKRVQEGQEMITSAIMGLLFVIFSIIILRFIGVTLLRIPGFGT